MQCLVKVLWKNNLPYEAALAFVFSIYVGGGTEGWKELTMFNELRLIV